jgi:hypothetical protein
MPLTQQPSFEAVKTLDVRPSTRAGNSKTTSYIPRRVLYTEVRIGRAQEVVHAQIYCLCPNVLPYTECIEVSVVWAWTGATPG